MKRGSDWAPLHPPERNRQNNVSMTLATMILVSNPGLGA